MAETFDYGLCGYNNYFNSQYYFVGYYEYSNINKKLNCSLVKMITISNFVCCTKFIEYLNDDGRKGEKF